jgi:ubiquinone/menaquinone biosynthesis C-methylase UbiE
MLQLFELERAVVNGLVQRPDFLPAWSTPTELATAADQRVAAFREERARRATEAGGFSALRHRLDRWVRTDTLEVIDRDDMSGKIKISVVQALHHVNVVLRSYGVFTRVVRPHVEAVFNEHQRPVEILELGSGSCEFALHLAKGAKKGFPIKITGSDHVPAFVEAGNEKAKKRGLDVEFKMIDARAMSHIETGSYDLVIITQAIHHFTPGELATVMAESRRIARRAFISIDGSREFITCFLLGCIATAATVLGGKHPAYDAYMSARKLYPDAELDLLARIAVSKHSVRMYHRMPGFTVLEVQ